MAITSAQLRGARAMLNLTQEQVARMAGVQRVAVARFEAGLTAPHGSTLERLRMALEEVGAVFIETAAGDGVMIKSDRSKA